MKIRFLHKISATEPADEKNSQIRIAGKACGGGGSTFHRWPSVSIPKRLLPALLIAAPWFLLLQWEPQALHGPKLSPASRQIVFSHLPPTITQKIRQDTTPQIKVAASEQPQVADSIKSTETRIAAPVPPWKKPFALDRYLADRDIHPTEIQSDQIPDIRPLGLLSFAQPFPAESQYVVIMDPGHGGGDQGTRGQNGLIEKHLTLDMARRVAELLEPHPHINVKLLRHDDQGFSRRDRVHRVHTSDADLMISLHFNSLPQTHLTLVESFYADAKSIETAHRISNFGMGSIMQTGNVKLPDLSFARQSRRIASIMQKNVFNLVSQYNDNAIDAGIKNDELYVLTRSFIPATLVELSCLSNRDEEQRLKNDDYKNEMANAIAEGIIEYFATIPIDSSI